jgi:drug/metabolite transporter (DMT)-like permease
LQTEKEQRLGIVYLVVVFSQVVLGGTFPAAKIALRDFDPYTLALLRFSLASIGLLGLLGLTNRLRRIRREDIFKLLLLGLLAIPLNQLLFLYGLQFTTPARSALWFGATPVFVLFAAVPLLKEQVSWRKVVGILLSLAGVGIILRVGAIEARMLIGDLIVLAAVASWAVYTVVGRPLVRRYGSLTMTAYALVVGTIMYLPLGIYHTSQFDFGRVTVDGWWGMVYLAIGTSVVGYSLWYWGLARLEATKLAIFQNLEVVAGAGLSVWLVGEVLGVDYFAGSVLVIIGVIVTQKG